MEVLDFDYKRDRRLELKMKGLVACHNCDQPIHRMVKDLFSLRLNNQV